MILLYDINDDEAERHQQMSYPLCARGLSCDFTVCTFVIQSKELALVNQAKCWVLLSAMILNGASKRMYFLRQLKRANVSCNDLVQFCKCIRPVVEYASRFSLRFTSFHYALPLWRIQKRALSIIMSSDIPYGTNRNIFSSPQATRYV